MLTEQQAAALRYINSYIKAHRGVSPSFAQIAQHVGINSASGISRLVGGLEERGFIRRLKHHARSIEVLRMPTSPPDNVRQMIEKGDLLLGHVAGINDERDSVPLLLAFRELWPSIKSALEKTETST